MAWTISANLGRHARPEGDARGWLWELTRGDQVVRIVIEISETAWSSDPSRLPDDTRQALETTDVLSSSRSLSARSRLASSIAGRGAAWIHLPGTCLPERKYVGFDPARKEGDLEGPVADRSALPDELVEPRLGLRSSEESTPARSGVASLPHVPPPEGSRRLHQADECCVRHRPLFVDARASNWIQS